MDIILHSHILMEQLQIHIANFDMSANMHFAAASTNAHVYTLLIIIDHAYKLKLIFINKFNFKVSQ